MTDLFFADGVDEVGIGVIHVCALEIAVVYQQEVGSFANLEAAGDLVCAQGFGTVYGEAGKSLFGGHKLGLIVDSLVQLGGEGCLAEDVKIVVACHSICAESEVCAFLGKSHERGDAAGEFEIALGANAYR